MTAFASPPPEIASGLRHTLAEMPLPLFIYAAGSARLGLGHKNKRPVKMAAITGKTHMYGSRSPAAKYVRAQATSALRTIPCTLQKVFTAGLLLRATTQRSGSSTGAA